MSPRLTESTEKSTVEFQTPLSFPRAYIKAHSGVPHWRSTLDPHFADCRGALTPTAHSQIYNAVHSTRGSVDSVKAMSPQYSLQWSSQYCPQEIPQWCTVESKRSAQCNARSSDITTRRSPQLPTPHPIDISGLGTLLLPAGGLGSGGCASHRQDHS